MSFVLPVTLVAHQPAIWPIASVTFAGEAATENPVQKF
jgi:hypothetical protein